MIDKNILLAKFLGYEFVSFDPFDDTKKTGWWLKEEEINLKSIDFDDDWNLLMMIIDKIESIDLSDSHYSWLDYDGKTTQNNFNGITVDITGLSCYIGIELQLDPFVTIAIGEGTTKKDIVYDACIKFVEWFNNNL